MSKRMSAVTIDRDALKLLASDTRLDILKALKLRRMTVSELSAFLALGKSTVFEHVGKLSDGGLVSRRDDPAREWVYYELTEKAKHLMNPSDARVTFLFAFFAGIGVVTAALLAFFALG